MKIKSFTISYIGDKPPTLQDIQTALIKAEVDDEGLIEVKSTEPLIEECEDCGGVGNVDEAAGFNLDCNKCKGTGYLTKK